MDFTDNDAAANLYELWNSEPQLGDKDVAQYAIDHIIQYMECLHGELAPKYCVYFARTLPYVSFCTNMRQLYSENKDKFYEKLDGYLSEVNPSYFQECLKKESLQRLLSESNEMKKMSLAHVSLDGSIVVGKSRKAFKV